MFRGLYGFTLVISICFIFSTHSLQSATIAHVEFDGTRLSVRSEGIALGELLTLMEQQTGVRFSLDRMSAESIVYTNFENNSLAEGIKRILSQLNHAMVYDESGQIRTVLVLSRKTASLQSVVRGELNAREPRLDGAGQRLQREGLGETGDALEQDVPVGEQGDEEAVDQIGLADEDAADLVSQRLQPGDRARRLGVWDMGQGRTPARLTDNVGRLHFVAPSSAVLPVEKQRDASTVPVPYPNMTFL